MLSSFSSVKRMGGDKGMKKRRFYKGLSLVLVMLLTFALLPMTAFAEAGD